MPLVSPVRWYYTSIWYFVEEKGLRCVRYSSVKHALASWASQIANYIEDFIVFGAATWRWIFRPVWVKPSRPSIVSPAIKVQLWCGHNKIYGDLCLREGRRSLYRWSWSCFYPVRIRMQCRRSCFPYDDFYDLQIEHKRGAWSQQTNSQRPAFTSNINEQDDIMRKKRQ